MALLKLAIAALVLAGIGGGAFLHLTYRQAMSEAEEAWDAIAAASAPASAAFDPAMLDGLPDVARRYFTHAIAPGTPLETTVELQMRGTFLLGDKRSFQTYAMEARQILRPARGSVWLPSMQSGMLNVSGSDAFLGNAAWTRFWINQLIPVADSRSSPDLVRSAKFRSAVEGIWAPAALLPGDGIVWEEVAPDVARVTFAGEDEPIILQLTLWPNGSVRQMVGQRWSNANPDNVFRYQPFGGTVEAETSFDGFTIPSLVKVGNHFGTEDYLPFFQAQITGARYR